jgi:hypothetical protein
MILLPYSYFVYIYEATAVFAETLEGLQKEQLRPEFVRHRPRKFMDKDEEEWNRGPRRINVCKKQEV